MRTATLFLSLVLSAGCVKADILYNNFLSTSPSYDEANGLFIENASQQIGLAFSFQTPGYDTYLTSITLGVTFLSGNSIIQVGLASDDGGLPGTIMDLQTIALQAIPVDPLDLTQGYLSEIVTYTPSYVDIMTQNSTYWVVAEGDGSSQLRWNYNTFGPDGGVNDSLAQLMTDTSVLPTVNNWTAGFNTQGAFEVQGNLVPEPGTIVLLSAGALAVGFTKIRRRSNDKSPV